MSTASFSYAQAARGHTLSQAASSSLPSTAATTPLTAPQEKDDTNVANVVNTSITSSTTASSAPSVVTDASKSAKLVNSETTPSFRKPDSDAASAAESSTFAGTLAESTSNVSRDDLVSDKSGRLSSSATRSSSLDDAARKGRKFKGTGTKSQAPKDTTDQSFTVTGDQTDKDSDNAKEKEKEAAKVIELAPAPPPAVNVWDQRRRDYSAKVKPFALALASAGPGAAPATTAAGGFKPKDTKKNALSAAETEATLDEQTGQAMPTAMPATTPATLSKSQARRPSDVARAAGEQQQPRRNGPRGNRAIGKDDKAALHRDVLPPVQDATFWPTPETAAIVEDTAKPSQGPSEKPDIAEKDSLEDVGPTKARKKGWVTLDFVPTVTFQTPINNVRGSKPKTGGRGGRDSSSRGGYNNVNGASSGDRASAPSTSTEKLNVETREQPLKESSISASTTAAIASATISTSTAAATPAVASLPAQTTNAVTQSRPPSHTSNLPKRFSAEPFYGRETRKPSAAVQADRIKESTSDLGHSTGKSNFVPRGNHVGAVNGDNGFHHYTGLTAHPDRRFVSATRNSDHHSAPGKESGNFQATKEQHGQNNSRERLEARGERSGRGAYRNSGRGGHNGSSAQSHHGPHSGYHPNGQQKFGLSSGYAGNGSTLAPNAMPYSPSSQQFPANVAQNGHKSSRNGGRAQPGPQGQAQPSFGGRVQNGMGMPSRMHVHAHLASANFSPEFQIQPFTPPYPLYAPYMDSELLHLLIMQVEYYFSVENLCKDLFLRKKMDGQGFVPLSVVANFKRMSELAPTVDFVRTACEHSQGLDYVIVMEPDHTELIRSKLHWSEFVLPEKERDEAARRPGPNLKVAIFRSALNRPQQPLYYPHPPPPAYPVLFPAAYPPNGPETVYQQPYEGGMQSEHAPAPNVGVEPNGRPQTSDIQLSAAVPDFSPGVFGGAPTTLEDYQNLSDEQIDKLVVLVGSDNETGTADTAEEPNGTQRHANGTISSSSLATGHVGKEPYPELRAKALGRRSLAKPGEIPAAMKHLYRFWLHCLPDKFNVRMYDDFRSSAMEDASHIPPNDFGLRYLIRYYDRVLGGAIKPRTSARQYPAVFIPHSIEAKQLADTCVMKANGNHRP